MCVVCVGRELLVKAIQKLGLVWMSWMSLMTDDLGSKTGLVEALFVNV